MSPEQFTDTKIEVGLIHINKGNSSWAIRLTDKNGTKTFTRPVDSPSWSEWSTTTSNGKKNIDIGSQTGRQLRQIINKYLGQRFSVYE